MTPLHAICLVLIVAVLWYYHSVCLICLQKTRTYAFLMYYVVPRWRLSICHTSMTDEKYKAGNALLQKDDTILTRDRWALSTWLVPGYWTHALRCVGEIDGEMMCVEMTRKGRGKVTFAKAAFHSSSFEIIRCPGFDSDYSDDMAAICEGFKDAEYDTMFLLGPHKIYCSEYLYLCDTENRMGVELSRAWGTREWVVSPDNLAAGSNVEVVYNSDEEQV